MITDDPTVLRIVLLLDLDVPIAFAIQVASVASRRVIENWFGWEIVEGSSIPDNSSEYRPEFTGLHCPLIHVRQAPTRDDAIVAVGSSYYRRHHSCYNLQPQRHVHQA